MMSDIDALIGEWKYSAYHFGLPPNFPIRLHGEREFYRAQLAALMGVQPDWQDVNCLGIAVRFAPSILLEDKAFMLSMIQVHPLLYGLVKRGKLGRDKDIIAAFLRLAGESFVDFINVDNRIGVAYALCKEFPRYEERLGAELRRKIAGMGLCKFVERLTLKKSLDRTMPVNTVSAKRHKI